MIDFLTWALVGLQLAIVGAIVIRELIRPNGRNLYAIVIGATMLVLVQGQDWWMLDQAEHHGLTRHINQDVTLEAIRLATFYCFLWACTFALAYYLTERLSRSSPPAPGLPPRPREAEQRFRRYWVPAIWVAVATLLLVYNSGGPLNVVLHPGRNLAGQALLLILLSIGKFPVLSDIATRRRPPAIALVMFGVTLLFTVLNSRFLALFVVLQVAIIANYCVAELRRLFMAGGAALAGVVLVGYGLFRDFESYPTTTNPIDPIGFIRFYATRSEQGPLTWFYQFNVEGFAGLAGILTREAHGGLKHDFGASTASIVTQLIPHAIRMDPNLPILRLSKFFESIYPYQGGSIVRPGLELAYAHFGVPGILALGILLGWLAVWLHLAMRAPERDRLLIGVLSVQVLLLVRGTFVDAMFFGLGDLVILIAYRQIQTFRPGQARVLSRVASDGIRKRSRRH